MKRLLPVAMLVLFLLPALGANYATALAGRTVPTGRWCECGTSGCICDPGEMPCTACPSQGLTVQQNTAQGSDPLNSIDLGTTFSLVVAAAVLALRLRQI